jgi:hypothetical protein
MKIYVFILKIFCEDLFSLLKRLFEHFTWKGKIKLKEMDKL